jgi:hypothetical protein
MQSVRAPYPVRHTPSRKLTVIVEAQYGRPERLERLVTPGMTIADLPLDELHSTVVQPGGGVVGRADDLFDIAADTPKLFALCDASPRVSQPAAWRRGLSSHAPSLGWAGRAIAAVLALPKPRHGVVR